MNPTPKTPDTKRKKWIWLAILAILIAAGGGTYAYQHSRKKKPVYEDAIVKLGSIANTTVATGSVLPQNRLEIKPPIPGRVDQVLVIEGQNVKKGQMLAWMSSSERAALMDAARSQGPDEVKRWEELYRPTPIVAPIDGMIILRNVESGQTFTSADAILVMSDRLTVKAQVDETDLAQIKVGQVAEIVLDAYSDQKISARVDKIAYEAKTTSNVTTYTVDVVPDKTPTYMRSGMTANVTFTLHEKEGVLTIPASMITTKLGVSSVLVPGPTEKAPPVSRTITTGLSDGKVTEVTSGLAAGEKILFVDVDLTESKTDANASPFGLPQRPKGRGTPGGGGGHGGH